MFALLKSNDVKAIAIAVIVIALGLYIVFHVVSFVANNIGTILVLAAIGLIATIAWFYYQSQKA